MKWRSLAWRWTFQQWKQTVISEQKQTKLGKQWNERWTKLSSANQTTNVKDGPSQASNKIEKLTPQKKLEIMALALSVWNSGSSSNGRRTPLSLAVLVGLKEGVGQPCNPM